MAGCGRAKCCLHGGRSYAFSSAEQCNPNLNPKLTDQTLHPVPVVVVVMARVRVRVRVRVRRSLRI